MTTEIALLETPSGGGRAEFALTLDQGSRVGARYKSHYGTVRPAGGGAEVECVYKVATGAMGKRVLSNEVAVWGGLRMEDVRADQFGTLLGFDVDSPDAPARLVQTRRGRPLAGTSPLPSERLRRPEARAVHRRSGSGFDEGAWAAFLDWARSYADPSFDGRNRAAHERWLANRR